MSSLTDALADGTPHATPPLLVIINLLGQSVALGVILCTVTYTFGRLLRNARNTNTRASLEKRNKNPQKSKEKYVAKRQQLRVRTLIASSNLLFLCVGLTGTMILVNNTMVRAFAIGAAIALVRFKVALDGRDSNSALLFSILSGIACGLHELKLAWLLIGIHALLSCLVALGPRIITFVVPKVKRGLKPIVPMAAHSMTDMLGAQVRLDGAPLPAEGKKKKQKRLASDAALTPQPAVAARGLLLRPPLDASAAKLLEHVSEHFRALSSGHLRTASVSAFKP